MYYIKHNGTQIASVTQLEDAKADLNVYAGQGMELSSLTIEDEKGNVVFEKPDAPKNTYVNPKATGLHVDTAAIANQEIAKHVVQDAARSALDDEEKGAALDGAAAIAHPSAAGTVATGLTGENNDETVHQAAADIVPNGLQPGAASHQDPEQAQAGQEAQDAGKAVPDAATQVAPLDNSDASMPEDGTNHEDLTGVSAPLIQPMHVTPVTAPVSHA